MAVLLFFFSSLQYKVSVRRAGLGASVVSSGNLPGSEAMNLLLKERGSSM
jgi:hypothetical protein